MPFSIVALIKAWEPRGRLNVEEGADLSRLALACPGACVVADKLADMGSRMLRVKGAFSERPVSSDIVT
jgi:hypothetical protein